MIVHQFLSFVSAGRGGGGRIVRLFVGISKFVVFLPECGYSNFKKLLFPSIFNCVLVERT